MFITPHKAKVMHEMTSLLWICSFLEPRSFVGLLFQIMAKMLCAKWGCFIISVLLEDSSEKGSSSGERDHFIEELLFVMRHFLGQVRGKREGRHGGSRLCKATINEAQRKFNQEELLYTVFIHKSTTPTPSNQ